ncbi:MAG: cytochrome c [Acidobacteriota bacterium]
MRLFVSTGSVVLGLALVIAACAPAPPKAGELGSGSAPSTATQSSGPKVTISDATRTLYARRCAMCHGPQGKGDGVAGRGLAQKPTDFTTDAWQVSVTDERIAKVTVHGGKSLSLSPLMPPQPDLQSPDKKQTVDELVALVRSFRGAGASTQAQTQSQ